MHQILLEAMREMPDLVERNVALRLLRDEADWVISAFEQMSGKSGSWTAH